jgi:hypothetical protein
MLDQVRTRQVKRSDFQEVAAFHPAVLTAQRLLEKGRDSGS